MLNASLRLQIAERKQELLEFLHSNTGSSKFLPPPIVPQKTGKAAPLSFAQERLWFLEQLEPQSAVYNICRAVRVHGNLNVSALEASLNEIVHRHETLRTAFRLVDGQPIQIVQPPGDLAFETVDLTATVESELDAEIRRVIKAEAEHPFDLQRGSLLRCKLLRLRDAENILILLTHHAASDAWSMGILTRELWSLYQAFSHGQPSPLDPLPAQYSDYAVWQRDWLHGEVLQSQLSYWKEQLEDLPVLNLPTDRPRKPRQSFSGARLALAFTEELTRAVNELSHRHGVTAFMTLLAAFQVLLYRYSGQEDFALGSPIANRRRTEIEGLIGFFVNTLVLRANLSGNPSFTEVLSVVKKTCLGADANQDLPFEKLVQEIQPERDQSRNPLFQVIFVLQNATRPFSGIPGLQIEPVETNATRSPFDLSLFLREREGRYIGFFEYCTDLFNSDRIERMVGHFQTLMKAIVADPDQFISTLPILTEAERHQILVEWNDTATDYPEDKCVHQLFEEQVERTPDAIAMEFEDQQITYWELNRRANQLAHYLISLGIGPEKLVGICVERSIEMVVGLLGILKAGGGYVPLDPAYPKERLRFMLEDAQVSMLLTQAKLLENREPRPEDGDPRSSIPPATLRTSLDLLLQVVCLDRDWPSIAQQQDDNPKRAVKSDNLAYVIYTSGSTGQPKGVAIEHRNTFNLLHWAKAVYAPEGLRSVLASTSICFDLSVFELFAPLSWGGKVVLVENALLLNDSSGGNVTLINTVPWVMTALLAAGRLPAPVETINLAGEPLHPKLVGQIYDLGSVKRVYDLYGPSETTTYSTFAPRTADGPPTIGRPISNTQIYVLDAHLQPVPIGVPGALYIGGAGVGRGYLNRPELTSETFIANPFSDNRGSTLYRTGDLARYLADGNIEFLGRTDNQVKIHGYRIELGEIEAVLNQHPAVRESVVVARERESSGDKDLIGYIVPMDASALSNLELLTSYLSKELPNYMVPSVFITLDTLPLTPNGKVDRNALPAPEARKSASIESFTEPRTAIEQLVAQSWREVLKIENVGIHDNFFELGGHSLLAVQIVARLREALNREVPLGALFDAPTVAHLSHEMEKLLREGHGPALPPIVRAPRDGPLPLSMNQEHLWRLDRMFPGNHFLNMPYVYQITGKLNLVALEKALEDIIRRHEVLRTYFAEIDKRPVQLVRPTASFRLAIVDLRTLQGDEISDNAAALIVEERQQPFDLAAGPLIRVKLLRLTNDIYFLLVTIHHIISDEWSVRVFRRELTELYKTISLGREAPLPESIIQYADFASWETQIVNNGLLDPQLDYWRKQLAGPSPQLQFRKVLKQKKPPSFRTKRQPINVNKNLFGAVKVLATRELVTPFIVVLSAINVLLHLSTGKGDIRIGTLVANRACKESEGVIGHFVNTVVLRTAIDPMMTLRQVIRQVRTVAYSALANQEIPFEQLARALEKERMIRRTSLFQVLLSYHDTSLDTVNLPGITFAPLHFQQPRPISELTLTACDIVFNIQATATKLTGHVNYKVDTCGNDVIALMVHRFVRILRRMIVDTGATVSSIS